MRKLLTITVPAFVAALMAVMASVEVWVRVTWDPRKGRPGLFIADPVRIEKLSANYDGWFAGVPVRTNALGFRDSREYALDKGPRTLRIVVLGDSVTFGHGSIYEHTYPYLLEQRLRQWKLDVDWQVWNLGVPGYNTSQELAHLLDVGPAFRPDLVIVGFFGNDLVGNAPLAHPTRRAIAASELKTWLKRHVHSSSWYQTEYLTLRYRLFASQTEHEILDGLASQEQLLAKPAEIASRQEQALTSPTPLTDAELEREHCPGPQITVFARTKFESATELAGWKAAVGQIQRLHKDGIYRIVFFVNSAPRTCQTRDVFDPRSTKALDDYLLGVLSDGTPAVSSHDAFIRYRPSQMPRAAEHSIGNSNAVKANVLFEFLRDRVLPPVLAGLDRAANRS